MNAAPLAPRASASASKAGTSTTLGWPVNDMLTSSKSSACDAAPLISAAWRLLAAKPCPTTVAWGKPPCSRASSASMCVTGSCAPANVTAIQSSRQWRTSVRASAGTLSKVHAAFCAASGAGEAQVPRRWLGDCHQNRACRCACRCGCKAGGHVIAPSIAVCAFRGTNAVLRSRPHSGTRRRRRDAMHAALPSGPFRWPCAPSPWRRAR